MKNGKKDYRGHPNKAKNHSGQKNSTKFFEGTISVSSKGTGYLRTEELKDDIIIDYAFLNKALHGDRVKVLIHSETKDYKKGGVIKILSRAKVGFAGVLKKEDELYILVPSDIRMYTNIVIPLDELNGAMVGEKVFALIKAWQDTKTMPEGRIIRVLGKPLENNAEMEGIALERGFNSTFSRDILAEAEKIKETMPIDFDEIKRRRDFRSVTTFTIDPVDAKDFDDAISFKVLDKNRYEIGIHIADVSHYVLPNSPLDHEAKERGTSLYLVDRTIPMLPEVLSNDLCSLKQGEDRLSFGAIFTIDKNGQILEEWFGKTVIRSQRRFTYEEAQKILDKGHGIFHEELNALNILAKKLNKERFKEGSISLDQEEVRFVLDDAGVPLSVYKKIRGDTNKLVEEFMLLANKKVAEFITKKNKDRVFVYRIHDKPSLDKINELGRFLQKLGYKINIKNGIVRPEELNALIESLEGKEEKDVIHNAIIRSMSKAIYSTKNIGHFGLAFKHYTHFTSPIRRYPDVIVHRLLQDYLLDKKIGKERWQEFEKISITASAREREATQAERESIKYKQVEYMSTRVGHNYDGVITGLTEWGIYVEERETKCEGMVKLRDLGDDFYMFNEKDMTIMGKTNKKKYRIGDKVKIKVVSADINKKVIDYIFI